MCSSWPRFVLSTRCGPSRSQTGRTSITSVWPSFMAVVRTRCFATCVLSTRSHSSTTKDWRGSLTPRSGLNSSTLTCSSAMSQVRRRTVNHCASRCCGGWCRCSSGVIFSPAARGLGTTKTYGVRSTSWIAASRSGHTFLIIATRSSIPPGSRCGSGRYCRTRPRRSTSWLRLWC